MRKKRKAKKWYLADLVMEHSIADESRHVIHINTVLINALTPLDAVKRALKLGEQEEYSYKNSVNKTVKLIFHGIANISKVDNEKLAHGTELFYREIITKDKSYYRKLVVKPKEYSIFKRWQKPHKSKPNYMPKNIYEMLIKAGFKDSDMFS